MNRLRVLILAAEFSLVYNTYLLLSVSLNHEWARTRAAGGQFVTFPISIRILYFFMAILMGALMFWLWDKRNGLATTGAQRITGVLAAVFSISTIFQLISRSPDERWNAIPAFILAFTFFRLVKESK